MSSGFEVVPEDLVAHASHLDGLSDRLGTAADAARTVSMSDSAYGLICQFVPPFVNPMEQKAMAAIEAAAEGVRTAASNMRSTATSYEEHDGAHATLYSRTLTEARTFAKAEARPTSPNLTTGD